MVSIERGSDRLTLCHPKLLEKIEDIVPLREHDAARRLTYFYSDEVVELLHVFHVESTGEELLDMFNVS